MVPLGEKAFKNRAGQKTTWALRLKVVYTFGSREGEVA